MLTQVLRWGGNMLAEYELNRERDENFYILSHADGICPVHFHRKVEVVYVLSGTKSIVAAGKEVVLGADSIFSRTATKCTGITRAPTANRLSLFFPTECCATIMRSSVTKCLWAT